MYYLLIMTCVAATCSTAVVTERPFAEFKPCSENAQQIIDRDRRIGFTSCVKIDNASSSQVSRDLKGDRG